MLTACDKVLPLSFGEPQMLVENAKKLVLARAKLPAPTKTAAI
jgi:hypothetical protein